MAEGVGECGGGRQSYEVVLSLNWVGFLFVALLCRGIKYYVSPCNLVVWVGGIAALEGSSPGVETVHGYVVVV